MINPFDLSHDDLVKYFSVLWEHMGSEVSDVTAQTFGQLSARSMNFSTRQNFLMGILVQGNTTGIAGDLPDLMGFGTTAKPGHGPNRGLLGFLTDAGIGDEVFSDVATVDGAVTQKINTQALAQKLGLSESQADSPLMRFLQTLSFRRDEARTVLSNYTGTYADMGHRLFGLENLPSPERLGSYLSSPANMKRILSGNVDLSKVLVLDTETAGLAYDVMGVREVSWGSLAPGAETRTKKFYTSPMDLLGRVSSAVDAEQAGGSRRLVSLLDALGDPEFTGTRPGKAFVSDLVGFLQEVGGAEAIIMQNAPFDIRQVFGNLQYTSEYYDNKVIDGLDRGFKDFLDPILEKVSRDDFVVDTLALVRGQLPELGLAPELALRRRLSTHGLENILMETNLVGLLEDAARSGDESAAGILSSLASGGQHQAEVDIRLTGFLAQNYENLQAASLPASHPIRLATARSAALLPTTNLVDPNLIDPAVFRAHFQTAVEAGDTSILGLASREGNLLGIAQYGDDADDVYRRLQSGELLMSGRINPITQSIVAARLQEAERGGMGFGLRGLDQIEEAEDALYNFGAWDRFSGASRHGNRGLLRRLSRRKAEGQGIFDDVVESLVEAKTPFAALSMEERLVSHAIARAGAIEDSPLRRLLEGFAPAEAQMADIAEDLLVGRWATVGADVTRSGVVNLPYDVLRDIGAIKGSTDATEGLSALQKARISVLQNEGMVTLQVDLDKAGKSTLSKQLDDIIAGNDANVSPSLKAELEKWSKQKPNLDKEGRPIKSVQKLAQEMRDALDSDFGVVVGVIEGDGSKEIVRAYEELYQGPIPRDADLMLSETFITGTQGLADEEARLLVDNGQEAVAEKYAGTQVLETAPVVHDPRIGVPRGEEALANNIREQKRVAGVIRKELEEGKINTKLVKASQRHGLGTDIMDAKALYDEVLKPNAKKLSIIGAGLIGGYYLYKKKKERSIYEEAMQQMPIEYTPSSNPGPYGGIDYSGSQYMPIEMDYLATAGVVGQLDRNKIGHTNMSSNRHSNLYSGVL